MSQEFFSKPSLLELIASDDPQFIFDRLSYFIEQVLDFSTPYSRAVFYSGSNRQYAEAFAKKHGISTLELTPGGKYLDDLDLFNNNGTYKFGPPLSAEKASELWDKASRKFALQARGYAYVFVQGIEPVNQFGALRTFFRIELPALLNSNKNMGTIYFMNNDGSTMGMYTIHL